MELIIYFGFYLLVSALFGIYSMLNAPVCDENGKAVPVASGGYKTAEEALKNCPQKSKTNPKFICVNGAVIESPTGVGFDTAEEARIRQSKFELDTKDFRNEETHIY